LPLHREELFTVFVVVVGMCEYETMIGSEELSKGSAYKLTASAAVKPS
jgi:hypothetical protein